MHLKVPELPQQFVGQSTADIWRHSQLEDIAEEEKDTEKLPFGPLVEMEWAQEPDTFQVSHTFVVIVH